AGLAIDGADVLAGAAANAVERLPSFAVAENTGSCVVHQDDVKAARAIVFVHTGPDGVVRIHALPGRAARQKLEEDFEVAEPRDDLVDACNSDQRSRQRQAHAPVALALDDAHSASLRDEEVCSADCSRNA